MIEAIPAFVRPRVISQRGDAPLLLDEEIRGLIEAGTRGYILIFGPSGAGKTTALQHLASTLRADDRVTLLDEPNPNQLVNSPHGLVICTTWLDKPMAVLTLPTSASYLLASWNRDDLIEYLLAAHRPRCASVMARIKPADFSLLGGLPELWRIVLDRLAGDDNLLTVRNALHQFIQEHLSDTDLLERARSACLNAAVSSDNSLTNTLIGLARPGFANSLIRVLRHRAMQILLASERIATDLHGEADCDYLAKRLPRGLVEAAGRLVAEDDQALEHLHALLAGPSWSHAMAASLLHAAGKNVPLKDSGPMRLAGAYLPGVSWPGVYLKGADLAQCDLARANLRQAQLTDSILRKTVLHHACLREAELTEVVALEADLREADLRGVRARRVQFDYATLEYCDLSGCLFGGCSFPGANLRHASFRGSLLVEAAFFDAEWEGADFSSADLTRANLTGRCLRNATWDGACFRHAVLDRCDLEYMTLPTANFKGASLQSALLTGSTILAGDFRGANLQNAGLADIEWEAADLRDADLRRVSFHMGSTRSGLVGSTIPCEGSKTGFYTDDYDEQTYKAPEEIRKANLCNADLRGANLDGVDFYLVDLRGALFDDKYADHLRRCGAILETRVEGND